MNKGELVKQVAERANLDPVSARRALDAVIEGITERLGAGEDVNLTGFGKFSVVQRAEREGVNPREPGTRIRIPARRSPRFTPGTQLRSAVAAGPDGQTALDPVSLMANQPTVIAPREAKEPEPAAPGVAIVAGQSDHTIADEVAPKSGARTRKSAAKGSGGSASKSSSGSAAKSSGASASKGSGKSSGKAASKGAASKGAASKSTSRRSGSRRTKES